MKCQSPPSVGLFCVKREPPTVLFDAYRDRKGYAQEKGFAILFLQLNNGDYLTIGEDIAIQVFANSKVRVSVQAPRDLTVLRGEVLERNGQKRPDGLFEPREKRSVSSGSLPVEI